MILSDFRGARLRALDGRLVEFAIDSEGAPDDAGDDGASLYELGTAIAGSMICWSEIMSHVAVERPRSFDPEVAGILVIESVFDELLDGPSLGLLIAAFELAVSTR